MAVTFRDVARPAGVSASTRLVVRQTTARIGARW